MHRTPYVHLVVSPGTPGNGGEPEAHILGGLRYDVTPGTGKWGWDGKGGRHGETLVPFLKSHPWAFVVSGVVSSGSSGFPGAPGDTGWTPTTARLQTAPPCKGVGGCVATSIAQPRLITAPPPVCVHAPEELHQPWPLGDIREMCISVLDDECRWLCSLPPVLEYASLYWKSHAALPALGPGGDPVR